MKKKLTDKKPKGGRGTKESRKTQTPMDDKEMNDHEKWIASRIRQYPDDNDGPFEVCIRKIDKPLEPLKLTRFIRSTFKSEITIKQVNEFKLRVFFSEKIDSTGFVTIDKKTARKEANELPNCVWNKIFRIYIPEKLVEVMGCIRYGIDEDVNEIKNAGCGRFRNNLMPAVRILDVIRFEKPTNEASASTERTKTPTVRVTFEGLVRPDLVEIEGLLIPVREFKQKAMFCDSCMSYNHTKSHCNNKPKIISTMTNECFHCKVDDHTTGDSKCPRRKTIEKRVYSNAKATHKKTFAEMLQTYDPNQVMPGEKNVDELYHLNLGTKRERQQSKPSNQPSTSKDWNFAKKAKMNSEPQNSTPPGFKNPNSHDENEIVKFFKSFIIELGLPKAITQIILSLLVPLINKCYESFTNSLMAKLSTVEQ